MYLADRAGTVCVLTIKIVPAYSNTELQWVHVTVAGRYWRGAKGSIRRFKSAEHAQRAVERALVGR